MPKTTIEVLPSPHDVSQLPVKRSDLDRLVQEKVAEILHAREEFAFEPWFRSRQIAYELKRLQTVSEQQTWTIYYNRFGCLVCQTQMRAHGGRGFCSQCYAATQNRLKQIRGEQIREEVAQPARGRLRLDRLLPDGKAADGIHHTRYERSTKQEREIIARVAARLGVTAAYVRSVAVGLKRSDAVAEALRNEAAHGDD